MALRLELSLLGGRRFALLFLAQTCSRLGTAISGVAVAFGVLALPGANATTLSLVLTGQNLAVVAVMLLSGVIADRVPRYRLMVGAELLAALASGLLAVLFLGGRAPVASVVGGAALAGVAVALFYPASVGMIPEVAAPDRLQAATGLLRLGTNLANLAGFALAGVAVAAIGPGRALVVDAVSFVVSAVLLAALRLPVTARTGGGPTMLSDLRHGWREFRTRQWLWVFVLMFSVVSAAFQGLYVLGPVLARAELGGAPAWSAILAGNAVGATVGVIAIRIRPGHPLYVATVLTLSLALPMALLGAGAPLAAVIAGGVVWGVTVEVCRVLWLTTLQREIPRQALSRISAYDWFGLFVSTPIGSFVVGPLAVAVGSRPALLVCAGVAALGPLTALLSPQLRRLTGGVPTDPGGPMESAAVGRARRRSWYGW